MWRIFAFTFRNRHSSGMRPPIPHKRPAGPTAFSASLASRTSPLFREGLRDSHRKRERVRERNIRRHGYDNPVLGERHQRRHHPAHRVPVVADHARLFARQRVTTMRDTRSTVALSDTSPKAREVYLQQLAELTPAERVRLGTALWESAQSLQRTAVRRKHPDADEAEIVFQIAVTRFGPELARTIYGRA
jgi:hypothetical protein